MSGLRSSDSRLTSSLEPTDPAPPRSRVQSVVEHPEARHAVKYSIVGVANVAIDLTLYAVMLQLGVYYVVAKALSELAAIANGYVFNRTWTFRAGPHAHAKLVRYAIVQGSGMALNVALVAVFVEVVGVEKLAAAVIALPLAAGYCFALNRVWTFGRHIVRTPGRP